MGMEALLVTVKAKTQYDARRMAEIFEFVNNRVNEMIDEKLDLTLGDMILVAVVDYIRSEC